MDASALSILTDLSVPLPESVTIPDTFQLFTHEQEVVKRKPAPREYTSVTHKFTFRERIVVAVAGLDDTGSLCELFIYGPALSNDTAQALAAFAQLLSLTTQFHLPLQELSEQFAIDSNEKETIAALIGAIMLWLTNKFDVNRSVSLDAITPKII